MLLAYSAPGSQDYCSVHGEGRVERDVARQKELWTEAARVWFPEGPESPNLAMIAVEIDGAAYWDSPSSAMLFAYGYAKAMITGASPEGGDVGRVDFR